MNSFTHDDAGNTSNFNYHMNNNEISQSKVWSNNDETLIDMCQKLS